MGVRLSEEEAWELIASSTTGILTTLRRDGWPVALPVWFAVAPSGRRIWVRTPARSAKVARLRADPRCGFLVESGETWAELAAVSLQMRGRVLDRSLPDEAAEAAAAVAAIEARYKDRRPPDAALPAATRRHYAERVILALDPVGPMVSWDNARIRLRPTMEDQR